LKHLVPGVHRRRQKSGRSKVESVKQGSRDRKHSADLPSAPPMSHLRVALCFESSSSPIQTADCTTPPSQASSSLHPRHAWCMMHEAEKVKGCDFARSADFRVLFVFLPCRPCCPAALLPPCCPACHRASAQERQVHFTRAPAREQIETHAAARFQSAAAAVVNRSCLCLGPIYSWRLPR
jgi:hypothetical protein